MSNLDDIFKFLGLIGTLTALAVGLFQYRKAQQWKRAEWVAQEMKAFFDQPPVQNALYMIDWGKRRIPLFPLRENFEDRYVEVTDDIIKDALLEHDQRSRPFSEVEEAIRDAFDCFLDGLEKFESYVGARLVKHSDLQPYLAYWCHNIATAKDGDPKVDRLVQLRKYMARYGYRGASQLIVHLSRALEINSSAES